MNSDKRRVVAENRIVTGVGLEAAECNTSVVRATAARVTSQFVTIQPSTQRELIQSPADLRLDRLTASRRRLRATRAT